jgi:very-short-patch-repair endonuclease
LGIAFRRQVIIAGFIADFPPSGIAKRVVAPSVRLVVEVDGRCHERRAARDARRDRKLERAGYRVVRLSAELVLRDLHGAVTLIAPHSADKAKRRAP